MPFPLVDLKDTITYELTPELTELGRLAVESPESEDVQTTGFINGNNSRGRSVIFEIDATVLGNEIISGEYGHSVFCEIDDFETYEPIFAKLQAQAQALFPTFEFKEFTKDQGAFFLKLPHKNGRYIANIEPRCVPTAPEKSSFENGAKLEITGSLNVYVNFGTQTMGFYLKTSKIIIDGGKKKSKR